MNKIHSGTNEFSHVKTDTVPYSWTFEAPEDHEHPYLLTVTVSSHAHSEGYKHEISEVEAATKAGELAREIYTANQSRS